MKLFFFLGVMLWLLSPAFLRGGEQHLRSGILLLGQGEFALAVSRFEAAVADNPEDAFAYYYLARARAGAGDLPGARAALAESARLDPELAASEAFQAALEPERPASVPEPPTAEEARRWRFRLESGLGYDSNLLLLPDLPAAAAAPEGKDDWRAFGSFLAEGRLDQWLEGTRAWYRLYQSRHLNRPGYDLTGHVAGFRLGSAAPGLQPRLRYELGYFRTDGSVYLRRQTLSPALEIRGRGGRAAGLGLLAERNDYPVPVPDPAACRSGTTWAGTAEIRRPAFGAGHLRAGCRYTFHHARGTDWRWRGPAAEALLLLPLRDGRWRLSLSGGVEAMDFRHPDTQSGFARADRRRLFSAAASRSCGQRAVVTLGHTFIRNRSNIESWQYRRHISSLTLSVLF